MKIYGLTGGIASGKSSVARILREQGLTVVDADLLARQVVEKGSPGFSEIQKRWPSVVAADGDLDRRALGAIVFSDPEARKELEQITHPRIAAESARLFQAAAERGEALAFYEAALLVENGLADNFSGLVVVSVPEDVQLHRLMERDGMSEEASRARIQAQLPLSDKLQKATHVIDNSQSREKTQAQTLALIRELTGNTPAS